MASVDFRPPRSACPGPLVWFNVPACADRPAGAVLECATCRNIVTTGNFMDTAHMRTPIITSPR